MTDGVCTGIAYVPCLRDGVNASVKFYKPTFLHCFSLFYSCVQHQCCCVHFLMLFVFLSQMGKRI